MFFENTHSKFHAIFKMVNELKTKTGVHYQYGTFLIRLAAPEQGMGYLLREKGQVFRYNFTRYRYYRDMFVDYLPT